MKLVENSPYLAYCELCGKGVDKFVEVGPYKVVCMDCADEIAKLLPIKPAPKPVKTGGRK
jgi:ribosome-binding protein aMBF1 (putative translation factor)